jgi:Fungal protein kinase
MASLRTPHRASARVQQDHRVKAEYDALRGEFQGCYVDGLEIKDFVLNVLRLPKEKLDAIESKKEEWGFASGAINDYYDECNRSGNNEAKLYPLFTRFVQRALKEAVNQDRWLADPKDSRLHRLFERKGAYRFACEKTVRKPDAWLYRAPLDDQEKAVWALVQNPFEFKKASSAPPILSLFPKPGSERLPRAMPPSAQRPRPAQSQLIFGQQGLGRTTSPPAASPTDDDSSDSEHSSSTGAAGTVTGAKRKRAALDDGPQKSKKTRLTEARCQLMGYMGQCLRSTNRFYNIGFSVDHDEMTITYIDRMIGMRSSSFNFLKNHTTFAAIMYAIHICHPQGMGFNRFLHATASPAAKSEPIQQMIGAFFHFPIRPSSRIHSDDPRLSDGGDIPLALLMGPQSYVSFQVEEIILESRGYTGRVTAVYRVKATFLFGITLELALKTSWQVEDNVRRPEAELIEGLVKDLPEKWRKHLPTVHFSDRYASDDPELDLPSRSLGFEKDHNLPALDLRGYQILASKLYKKLIDASNPAQIVKVWLDSVRCKPCFLFNKCHC